MHLAPFRYFMLNKPQGMESQFVSPYQTRLLGDINFNFPEGTHAIGRLDKDSEGLLLLTTNKKITALLFQSRTPHKRTYLVEVKHQVSAASLERLRTGVPIRIRGGDMYTTPPCEVHIVEQPPGLFPPTFPKPSYGATTWLLITLTEGRYHQVRKMMTAIRHRCQRLIRVSIEDLLLNELPPGCVQELSEEVFFTRLNLDTSSIIARSSLV